MTKKTNAEATESPDHAQPNQAGVGDSGLRMAPMTYWRLFCLIFRQRLQLRREKRRLELRIAELNQRLTRLEALQRERERQGPTWPEDHIDRDEANKR